MTAYILSDDRFVLGEGPRLNPADGSLSWVDIEAGRIFVGHIRTAPIGVAPLIEITRSVQVHDRVGCAFPLAGGRFLAGIGRSIAIVDHGGSVDLSDELIGDGRRFNDGIIDFRGRLIIGSLSMEGEARDNVLLRLELDGSVTILDDDLQLANGLGFSPDARTLYVVDSLAHVVYARDYDADTGAVGPRRVFAEVGDAEPDGLAVDSEGDVWVALWRGHGIRRFGADGALKGEVTVGPPHVTSLCFLPDAAGIFVTTASLGMTDDESARHPDAGALFLVPSNRRGRPMFSWVETPLPGR